MPTEVEIAPNDYIIKMRSFSRYLLSKWVYLLLAGLLFGLLGIFFAWTQKAVYTSELTFASENDADSKMSSYAGIAAQFGFDLGGGGGSVFEGENLMLLLKSRLLLQRTFLTPVQVDGKEELLINYYLRVTERNEYWSEEPALRNINFTADYKPGVRIMDSIMKAVILDVTEKSLMIDKVDKKMNIVAVRLRSNDELFAKMFVEQLVNNAITFYVDYKIKKTKQNVQILQKQTDSVKNMLTGNIVSVAAANDLNVNPLRQIVRAGTQRRQVDVQVNGQLYGELLKQLEFSKITLRKETPLIQVIDTPQLPLDKKKLGRLKAGLIFSIIGFFLVLIFFVLKRMYNNAMQPKTSAVSTSSTTLI